MPKYLTVNNLGRKLPLILTKSEYSIFFLFHRIAVLKRQIFSMHNGLLNNI